MFDLQKTTFFNLPAFINACISMMLNHMMFRDLWIVFALCFDQSVALLEVQMNGLIVKS